MGVVQVVADCRRITLHPECDKARCDDDQYLLKPACFASHQSCFLEFSSVHRFSQFILTMDSSAMPPPPHAPHSQVRRYSPGEWEAQKPRIEELYVKEWRTLKEVMNVLKDECGFVASCVPLPSSPHLDEAETRAGKSSSRAGSPSGVSTSRMSKEAS